MRVSETEEIMELTKEQMEKVKTWVIIILGVLVFFGVTYFVSENIGDRSKDKEPIKQQANQTTLLEEGEVLNEDEQSELTAVTMTDLKNILENGEKKIIMLGTETCHWCIEENRF